MMWTSTTCARRGRGDRTTHGGSLYGYGPDCARATRVCYTVVWVADDPSETDMDPLTDGGESGGAENPGRGRLSITAHGYGPAGTRRIVEATVGRAEAVARLSWRHFVA